MSSANGTTTPVKRQKDKHFSNSTLASEPNPLVINHQRFLANEITDPEMRKPINRAHAAFNGIRTIGKVLYANEVEKQANSGEWSLPATDQDALFQTLSVLAEISFLDLEELGDYVTGLQRNGGV